jgi:hypothetical protein
MKRAPNKRFTQTDWFFDRPVRPRSDRRGVDLISAVLPFRRLWYGEPDAIDNEIGYAKFFSRSHDAVIRVYDAAGNGTQAGWVIDLAR